VAMTVFFVFHFFSPGRWVGGVCFFFFFFFFAPGFLVFVLRVGFFRMERSMGGWGCAFFLVVGRGGGFFFLFDVEEWGVSCGVSLVGCRGGLVG